MGEWVKVAVVSDLDPGQGKTVERKGVEMALFNLAGSFQAIGNACPHRKGPLAEGETEGSVVTCPWHGWRFDVMTGRSLRSADISVPTYRTQVRGDDVFVELP